MSLPHASCVVAIELTIQSVYNMIQDTNHESHEYSLSLCPY